MAATLWSSIPASWQGCLASCRSSIDQIDVQLAQCAKDSIEVVPSFENIFAALKISPDDISVVVIGQDPYPTPSHAIGLAFAVPSQTKPLPGSLRNIFKEVAADTGSTSTADASLGAWVEQGVLLLNTSLTTESGIRAAHATWPWEPVVRAIIAHVVEVNPLVVGLLLGNHAKKFGELFDPKSIVSAAHPSPLSASRGFLSSKPFTQVNEILMRNGKSVIDW
jgi:uracil-DNA glycosylase